MDLIGNLCKEAFGENETRSVNAAIEPLVRGTHFGAPIRK
jgi:hypothetical protein